MVTSQLPGMCEVCVCVCVRCACVRVCVCMSYHEGVNIQSSVDYLSQAMHVVTSCV